MTTAYSASGGPGFSDLVGNKDNFDEFIDIVSRAESGVRKIAVACRPCKEALDAASNANIKVTMSQAFLHESLAELSAEMGRHYAHDPKGRRLRESSAVQRAAAAVEAAMRQLQTDSSAWLVKAQAAVGRGQIPRDVGENVVVQTRRTLAEAQYRISIPTRPVSIPSSLTGHQRKKSGVVGLLKKLFG